jgi:hypothetical protein
MAAVLKAEIENLFMLKLLMTFPRD